MAGEDSGGGGAEGVLLVARAYAFAAERHRGQTRKGAAQEPYIEHLIEVAALVAEAAPDEAVPVAAAVLHDVVEDTATPPAEVARLFGPEVAALVAEVTDDKTLPKAVRKQRQVETAPCKSRGAKLIKLADKISNLRSLVTSPPEAWPADRRLGYVRWAREVAAGLRGADARLEILFDEAAEAAERHMREA